MHFERKKLEKVEKFSGTCSISIHGTLGKRHHERGVERFNKMPNNKIAVSMTCVQ